MDLSVITVTWNAADTLERQVRSVKNGCQNISYEQIVVDNASQDNTLEIVERNFPEVILIKNNRNTGFSYPNNQAANIARGEFFLFLNPDMRVEIGSLDKLVGWMKNHPDIGIASCKLTDEYGKFNWSAAPRRFPTLLNQLAVVLKLPHIFPGILDHYLNKNFNPELEQEVDSVRGSFMLMRRELYEKLGWAFDPRYFIWFEDVDVCREARRLDYQVVYTPLISCVDYVGSSFRRKDFFWKQWNFFKSAVKYFCKWR